MHVASMLAEYVLVEFNDGEWLIYITITAFKLSPMSSTGLKKMKSEVRSSKLHSVDGGMLCIRQQPLKQVFVYTA